MCKHFGAQVRRLFLWPCVPQCWVLLGGRHFWKGVECIGMHTDACMGYTQILHVTLGQWDAMRCGKLVFYADKNPPLLMHRNL